MKKPKSNPSWDKGHPDALHLDPTYTDYLEAKRDRVQRLAKKLDPESKRDSKPEWDKWTDTSTVTLWEAIALSLNVEPENLQCLKRYPLPPWLDFDECPKEFRRRLDIAKKRVSELAANSENSNPIEETEVILSRLRIMSEKLKKPWKFPDQFPGGAADHEGASAETTSATHPRRLDDFGVYMNGLIRRHPNANRDELWKLAIEDAKEPEPSRPWPICGFADREIKWQDEAKDKVSCMSRKSFLSRLKRIGIK